LSSQETKSIYFNERIVPAKNGLTLLAGETALHSRYDPVLEAEKYIVSLGLKPCRCFILIEPGLGYLAAALKKYFPSSRIITLHCSRFFHNENNMPYNFETGISWNPLSAEILEDFLERSLSDTDASQIKLIDWKPSINAYGKACLDLTARTVECIRQITAGRKTVRNFGRRWIKNVIRNLEVPYPAEVKPGSIPVVICAAGPSLEDSFSAIQEWKQSSTPPFLIAVSSAVPALLNQGIKPDIIIATDGGPWALIHLTESFRQYGDSFVSEANKPVLAAAVTAALPSQAMQSPVLFLSDGSVWQELLLQAAGFPSLRFPQRGTVSVSALDLAFFISSGNVYISGLDFSHRDLITHARPQTFRWLLEGNSNRREPLYSRYFEREEIIRRSGSYRIYETWFKTHLNLFPSRLYSLDSTNKSLGIPGKTPQLTKGEFPQFSVHPVKPGVNRKYVQTVLLDALSNPMFSEQISRELGELLLPECTPNPDAVKNALLELW